jgi:hypothetical protein
LVLAWLDNYFIRRGGLYAGSKVYDLFKRRSEYTGIFLAVCLGFAVFFCAGVALRYVFVKLPGVGWRLDRQMLSTGMGSNISFKADGYAAA